MNAIHALVRWANENQGFLQVLGMLSAIIGVVGAWIARSRNFRRDLAASRNSTPISALAPPANDASRVDASHQPKRAAPPRVLVLPIRDHNTNEEDDFFVDGLIEDIIAGLSRSPWLLVIDSGTSLSFKDRQIEPRLIGAELGVSYVVHGKVRRSGSQLRASFYLINVLDGAILWSEQFDCDADHLFDLQDKIKSHVIASIEPASFQHQAASIRRRTQDLEQWEMVMRARYLFWKTSRDTNAQARELLEQAIELDANDSRAWGILAMTHLNDAWHGWSSSVASSLESADRASREAVRADDSDPWAHHTRAAVTGTLGNLDQAEADLHRALNLNPHLAAALGDMTRVLAFAGKTHGAIAFAQRAIEASPRDQHLGLWYYWIALVHFIDADYEAALPWLGKASAIRPDWPHPHQLRAVCLAWLDRREAAAVALAESGLRTGEASLVSIRTTHPFRDPRHLERYLDGLRRCGWSTDAIAPATTLLAS